MAQLDQQLAQLRAEKQRSLDLAEQLRLSGTAHLRAQQVNVAAPGSRDPPTHRLTAAAFLFFAPPPPLQLQEQLAELEHERDLLKESNARLLSRFAAAGALSSAGVRVSQPRWRFAFSAPSTRRGSRSGRSRSSSCGCRSPSWRRL